MRTTLVVMGFKGHRYVASLSTCAAFAMVCWAAPCFSQEMAMQDSDAWSGFVPAVAPSSADGPLPEVAFLDANAQGPWRVSDQHRIPASLAILFKQMDAAQWDKALHSLKSLTPDLSWTDEQGRTPLTLAAQAGQLPLVREMLRQGAQPDQAGVYGWTPLTVALWHGHELVVRDLLRAGARVDVPSRQGQWPVHVASAAGNIRLLSMLVSAGADWRITNRRGHHALAEAAFFGQLAVLQWWQSQGVALTTPDANGLNALHAAAAGGQLNTARWLKSQGVPESSALTPVLIQQLTAPASVGVVLSP